MEDIRVYGASDDYSNPRPPPDNINNRIDKERCLHLELIHVLIYFPLIGV